VGVCGGIWWNNPFIVMWPHNIFGTSGERHGILRIMRIPPHMLLTHRDIILQTAASLHISYIDSCLLRQHPNRPNPHKLLHEHIRRHTNRVQECPPNFSASLVPEVFIPFIFSKGIIKKSSFRVIRHKPNPTRLNTTTSFRLSM